MSFNSSINRDVVRTGINRVIEPGKPRRRSLLQRMKRHKLGSGKRFKLFKKFRMKVNNRLRGSYGEIDLAKNLIQINKKRHKTNPTHKKRYAELADTIRHERFHLEHPKARERTVRKMTSKWIKSATKKQKSKMYSMLKGRKKEYN